MQRALTEKLGEDYDTAYYLARRTSPPRSAPWSTCRSAGRSSRSRSGRPGGADHPGLPQLDPCRQVEPLQERLVVAHDHEGTAVGPQRVHELVDARQVEVVRRLVEHEHRGGGSASTRAARATRKRSPPDRPRPGGRRCRRGPGTGPGGSGPRRPGRAGRPAGRCRAPTRCRRACPSAAAGTPPGRRAAPPMSPAAGAPARPHPDELVEERALADAVVPDHGDPLGPLHDRLPAPHRHGRDAPRRRDVRVGQGDVQGLVVAQAGLGLVLRRQGRGSSSAYPVRSFPAVCSPRFRNLVREDLRHALGGLPARTGAAGDLRPRPRCACRCSARCRCSATRTSRSTAACCTATCASYCAYVPPYTVAEPCRSSTVSSTCSRSSRSWLTTTRVPRQSSTRSSSRPRHGGRGCSSARRGTRSAAAQSDAGDRGQDGLPAGQRRDRPVQDGGTRPDRGESDGVEGGDGPLLEVPVVPDGVEVLRAASPSRIARSAVSAGRMPSRSATVSSGRVASRCGTGPRNPTCGWCPTWG